MRSVDFLIEGLLIESSSKSGLNHGSHSFAPISSSPDFSPSINSIGSSKKAANIPEGSPSQASKFPRSDKRAGEWITTPSVPDDLPSFTGSKSSPPPPSSGPTSPTPGSAPTDFQGYRPTAQFEEADRAAKEAFRKRRLFPP